MQLKVCPLLNKWGLSSLLQPRQVHSLRQFIIGTRRTLAERLANHPDLEQRFSEILNIVEAKSGTLDRADDAEDAVANLQKLGKKSLPTGSSPKNCKKTFNAMSCTPLAHLRARDKLDQYLECMQGKTTLRVAAEQCNISLPTSFSLRHWIMRVIQNDKVDFFRGITEIDETFFLENYKGQRNLGEQVRKRGGAQIPWKKETE